MMETSTLIASILNFAVVLFILIYFGRKPFGAFLVARSEAMKTKMAEADKVAAAARLELSKWETNWKSAGAHAKQNRTDAEESLKRFGTKTLSEAQHEAERIVKEAQLMGTSEMLKAKHGLQKELLSRSVELAELHLGEHLPVQDKHKLISDFVGLVGENAK